MPSFPKADLIKRIIAAFIDGLIAGLPSFIPVIGPIVGTAYILTKDAVVFALTGDEAFKNRSVGKKLMNLQVVVTEAPGYVDWNVSIRRNLPLAIGSIIMIIPILGWVIGPIVGFIIALIELFLVLSNNRGQRLGDQFAGTQVIESAVAPAASTAPVAPVTPAPAPSDAPMSPPRAQAVAADLRALAPDFPDMEKNLNTLAETLESPALRPEEPAEVATSLRFFAKTLKSEGQEVAAERLEALANRLG